MVALELMRHYWLWGMLLGGVVLSGWVYLALYGAPDRPAADDTPLDPGEGEAEGHEFFGGIREGNASVPAALKLFILGMALFAVSYVLWIRFQVGSY